MQGKILIWWGFVVIKIKWKAVTRAKCGIYEIYKPSGT